MVLNSRNFDMDVDPVQQRAGKAGTIAVDFARGAGAAMGRIAAIAARTGVC